MNPGKIIDDEAIRVIDALGGTSAVAKMCKVTGGAVSQWKTKGIPESRLMYIELAFPDVFVPKKSNDPS